MNQPKRKSLATYLHLSSAGFLLLAAFFLVWQVNLFMHKQALEEASEKARLLLDRTKATHDYFTDQLRPSIVNQLKDWDPLEPKCFAPEWMSSTFANREIDKYFFKDGNQDYYFKDAAINARSPENEAAPYEREFIRELNGNPQLKNRFYVKKIEGEPFLIVLRKGATLLESCLPCHSTPERAPRGLVALYGPERSFGRNMGEVISALSLRIPLQRAYASADLFCLRLSLLILVVLGLLFWGQLLVHRRFVLQPLNLLHSKTREFLADEKAIGQQLPLPESFEYAELAASFNKLSIKLRRQIDTLDKKVRKRTGMLQKELSERIFAEEALRESRRLLLAVLDNSPLLIAVKDEAGRFTLANRRFEVLDRRGPEWLFGKSVFEVFSAETARELTKDDATVLESGHIIETEELLAHADGTRHNYATVKFPLVLSDGAIGGICSISSDVTDKLEAAKDKERLRMRLLATWNIARLSDRDFSEISANILREALSLTGSRFGFYGEVKNDQSIATIHAWNSGVAEQQLMEATPGSFPVIAAEIWARALKHKEAFLENSYRESHGAAAGTDYESIEQLLVVPVVSGAGRVRAVLMLANKQGGFCREELEVVENFLINVQLILEKKEAQEEKEKLVAQLDQAQKMEAIGTLAGGIAHDFNNILGTILGYADLALEDVAAGSTVAKDLGQVIKGGCKAKELVRQILAFSRQSQVEPILFRPSHIIKEVIALLRSSIPSTIEISQNIDCEAGLVLMDPTQLHQIVMNLCTNAFHAMESQGGELFIGLAQVESARKEFPDWPDFAGGSCVQLTVRDTGSGIEPRIKEKIFEPYFTTKAVGKGTGMGLAIIHGIVKGAKGAITMASQPEKGTTFQVWLPTTDSVEEPFAVRPESPAAVFSGQGLHVLFADDEEDLVEMGVDMLERLGARVTIARNGLQAWQLFEQDPGAFDLVFTDQTMPGMTGAEVAKQMLARRPELPIVLCTGFSNAISEEQAKQIGIREFAFKPLIKSDIARLVAKALAKA